MIAAAGNTKVGTLIDFKICAFSRIDLMIWVTDATKYVQKKIHEIMYTG